MESTITNSSSMNFYPRVSVSDTVAPVATIKMRFPKKASRLLFVLIRRWWYNQPCNGPNTTGVKSGLIPSFTLHTWKIIQNTYCIACLLQEYGPTASCIKELLLTPILWYNLCTSLNLRYKMDEIYLSGSLGIDMVIAWSDLQYIPVWLV